MDNKVVLKRPKVNDDEEELLRQQEEFLKAQQQPSVKLISHKNSAKEQGTTRAKSQFSRLRQSRAEQDVVSTSQGSGEIINPTVKEKIQKTTEGKLKDMVQNIPTASSNIILGNIMEKKFDIKKYEFNNCDPRAIKLGFPKVFGSDDIPLTQEKNEGKQSLFWQKVSKLKSMGDDSVKNQRDKSSFCNKKEITEMDDQLSIEIHKKNLERLAQMSETEILEEKRKLEETLDPKLIQFLRNKKKKTEKRPIEQDNKQSSVSVSSKTIAMNTEAFSDKKMKLSLNDTNLEMECENDKTSTAKKVKFASNNTNIKMDYEDDNLNIPESSKEIFKEGKQKGWLHMNAPEPEKMKWMEDLPKKEKDEPTPTEEYNARFDFNG